MRYAHGDEIGSNQPDPCLALCQCQAFLLTKLSHMIGYKINFRQKGMADFPNHSEQSRSNILYKDTKTISDNRSTFLNRSYPDNSINFVLHNHRLSTFKSTACNSSCNLIFVGDSNKVCTTSINHVLLSSRQCRHPRNGNILSKPSTLLPPSLPC